MYAFISKDTLTLLAQTAKTRAISGAAAGLLFGVIQGVISARRNRLRDGYDLVAEGLTHVGNGAILGVLGALTASVVGVSVAAIAGRGVLTLVAPIAASAIVTGGVHTRVDRLVRPWGEGVAYGLKRALQPKVGPEGVPHLPRS